MSWVGTQCTEGLRDCENLRIRSIAGGERSPRILGEPNALGLGFYGLEANRPKRRQNDQGNKDEGATHCEESSTAHGSLDSRRRGRRAHRSEQHRCAQQGESKPNDRAPAHGSKVDIPGGQSGHSS